jgi:hypothetical protein
MKACFALILVTMALLPTSNAFGAELQPIEMSVDGGEEAWHAEPTFAVRWGNPQGVAAVHYRLLDPDAEVSLMEARIGWPATAIQHLTVPEIDGAYTVEIWLEDGAGAEGPPVAAKLRFDHSPPGDVEPAQLDEWIGRTHFPLTLQIGHPAGPEPPSGIRGYAISIDRGPGAKPCAEPISCDETETDLRDGIEGDSVTIADLPEGISYLHAVAVSGSGIRSTIVGEATLHVDKTDPATDLAGAPEDWSRKPLTLVVTATDEGAGMAPVGGGSTPFTAIRIDDGAPIAAVGDRVSTTVIDSGVHAVAYYARDAAGNVNDGGKTNGQPNGVPQTAVVRLDRVPPALAFTNAQDPAEPERIVARGADDLSGIDPSAGAVAVRPAGSTARFEPLPTKVSDSTLSASWDSESYPPGEYEFRATAFDRAGNPASTTLRADGAAMRLRNPLKVPTHLSAGLTRNETGTVPCDRAVSFGGRLIAGRRAPLADIPIRVVERFAGGSERRERVSTLKTKADGSFHLRLHPGPSRRVFALAAASATLQSARSPTAALAVSTCVSLHVSSSVAAVGGRPVVFRGRVRPAGAAIPEEGVPVQLQFRLPGLPWGEFRTVGTDQRGGFRYAYSFADDDSRGVRFQFRVFVPARAGWPFEPAGSRPVTVRGA